MRTLAFRSHVLLALAAAAGVVAALARPWYAPTKPVTDTGDLGPLSTLSETIRRWLADTAGTTGWDALGPWGTALAALAAVTAIGACGCLVPGLQGVAREA